MAGHAPRILLLLLIITAFSYTSSATSSSSDKVSVELYYESLCPYCANLIVNHLYKIFDTGIIEITDLKLIPYGNAKIKPPNSTIVCQHGPDECLFNTIESCAIDTWPDVNTHFPFVYCVESLIYAGKRTEWATCFEKLSLDPTPVNECFKNGHGKEIELKYAVQTKSLQPPHTYVPWLTVDGQPLYDEYRDFMMYICEAYKGTSLPAACKDYTFANYLKAEKRGSILSSVCYVGAKIKSAWSTVRSVVSAWVPGVTEAAL